MSEGEMPFAPALIYVRPNTDNALCVAARSCAPRESCTQQWPDSGSVSRSAAVAPSRCRLFMGRLVVNFVTKPFRRQESAYAVFPDGGADHTECIARSAAVPRPTDFRVCLQVVVKLCPAAPEKV